VTCSGFFLIGVGLGMVVVPFLLFVSWARSTCGAMSCPLLVGDPEFPSLICTLPRGHTGMHEQAGVAGRWETPEDLAVQWSAASTERSRA